MKTRFYLALVVAVWAMTSCTQDVTMETLQNNVRTLTAVIDDGSRSAVTDGGTFSWSAGDAISVWNGSEFVTYNYVDNTGNQFTVDPNVTDPGTPTGYAFYPAGNNHNVDGPKVNLPTSYTSNESTNAIMMAEVDNSGTLTFKHLGGLMRFVIKNVPEDAGTFTFTANQRITGEFTVTNEKIEVDGTQQATESPVSITYEAGSAGRTMTFYVPLPTGTYSGFSIMIAGKTYTSSAANTISKGTLLLMPTFSIESTSTQLVPSGNMENEVNLEGGEQELDVEGTKTVVVDTEGVTGANAVLNVNYTPEDSNSALTISDGSDDSVVPGESKATVNVNADNNNTVGTLTIDAPTLTVNLTSGSYGTVTAKTAQNTLIIGSGVTIDELIVEGGNVKLEGDLALTKTLVVSQDMTLDLGGNALTVENAGGIIVKNGTFTIKNGKLLAETKGHDAISIQGEAGSSITVNVESNATLKGGDCCIVVPSSNASTDITINTSGTLVTNSVKEDVNYSGYAAISANASSEGVMLNVKGGSITAKMAGIYFPCKTELNITAGEITGATAVYQKSGTLTISGGTLTGNGEAVNYTYNGNGCNETGDALVIESCNYPKGTPIVKITGGTFVSENAKAIGSYVGNGVDEADKITGFVYGGLFSDASAFEHLGNGADVTLTQAVTITEPIVIKNGIEATINLKGSVTATNCDAFKVEGTLTINSGDTNEVTASGDNVCAVWACGGTVTINGGHYKVGADSEGKRNDCIYAGYNADQTPTLGTITIKAGKFEYTGSYTVDAGTQGYNVDYDGDTFLLNCANSDDDAHIIVEGGMFKNHVPSYEAKGVNGENEVSLGTDKSVYSEGNKMTSAHTGTTDIWYTVK